MFLTGPHEKSCLTVLGVSLTCVWTTCSPRGLGMSAWSIAIVRGRSDFNAEVRALAPEELVAVVAASVECVWP